MKTNKFLQIINNTEKELNFILPNGEKITGDLHITEVKNVRIDSTDCGGNSHSFEETWLQLWINEDSNRLPYWTTNKAKGIFNIVESKQPFFMDSTIFVEFGDSKNPTSKYSFNVEENETSINLKLWIPPTECKPRSLANQIESECCVN